MFKSMFFAVTVSIIVTNQTEAESLNDNEITQLDLTQLRTALDKKEITSEQLVSTYLSAIVKDNHEGKRINAIITLNKDAISEAKAWDKSNVTGHKNAPLAGIPFVLKDNFNTRGIATTGGSLALATNIPTTNAYVVQKLIDDGAIILGKANMSELAASYGWMGYSSVGGQTVNPFNPLRDPSGSSSGSAAAVAAGFAPFALGTDDSGSIRGPASVTGTVGMRPTLGLTSRSGVIPLSLTADDVGVITRSVRDQAIVLDAIRGRDLKDKATAQITQPATSFESQIAAISLRRHRFAVLDNFDGGNPDVDRVKNEAVDRLIRDGANIEHIRLPKEYEKLWSLVLGPVGNAEFQPQFNAYLSGLKNGQPENSSEFLQRLNDVTDNGTKKINPKRYAGLIENLNSTEVDSPQYISILTKTIPHLKEELEDLMKKGKYDAIVFTTMSCPASVIHGKSDAEYVCKSYDSYAPSYIASSTGFPEISVPAGKALGNIPVGISFMGKTGDDLKILQYAYQFELK